MLHQRESQVEIRLRSRENPIRGYIHSILDEYTIVVASAGGKAFVAKSTDIVSVEPVVSQAKRQNVYRKQSKIHFSRGIRDVQDVSTCPAGVSEAKWLRRTFLFKRFDDGIQLDAESWYSVTPEDVARHIAKKCACNVIIDACAGAGGNSIQFARTCDYVLAVELDSDRVQRAKHNASVYGVSIEFVAANCMTVLKSLPNNAVDVVFLSPPWGGPSYRSLEEFSLVDHILLHGEGAAQTWNGRDLFREASRVAKRGVAYFLPRNITLERVCEELGEEPAWFESHCIGNDETFTQCAYFGEFAD